MSKWNMYDTLSEGKHNNNDNMRNMYEPQTHQTDAKTRNPANLPQGTNCTYHPANDQVTNESTTYSSRATEALKTTPVVAATVSSRVLYLQKVLVCNNSPP